MSLHAELNPAALEKLHSQRRVNTISSLTIAVLSVVLIATVLGLFLLPEMVRENATITYTHAERKTPKPDPKKIPISMERKPSSPAASMVRVIAAATHSPVAIPIPEVAADTLSVEFGDGNAFESGWKNGEGSGSVGGGAFGSTTGPGLVGTFYDLKQTPDGKATKMAIQEFEKDGSLRIDAPVNVHYDERLERAIRRNLDDRALKDFYQAETQLRLTQLYVPRIGAEEAPKEFKVDGKVQGRRWVINYQGAVTPPESGRFRFVGFSDDVLVVLADNRVVLDGSLRSPLRGAERRKHFHQTHTIDGWNTYVGKTITVTQGRPIDLKILIGERPGGHYSGYLLLEKIGLDYAKDTNGSPILPLFKMAPGETPTRGHSLPDLAPDAPWALWRAQS
jgi:hypothetical protein